MPKAGTVPTKLADNLAETTGEGSDNATAATVRRNLIASLEDMLFLVRVLWKMSASMHLDESVESSESIHSSRVIRVESRVF